MHETTLVTIIRAPVILLALVQVVAVQLAAAADTDQ
jgi:hypothetical protein